LLKSCLQLAKDVRRVSKFVSPKRASFQAVVLKLLTSMSSASTFTL